MPVLCLQCYCLTPIVVVSGGGGGFYLIVYASVMSAALWFETLKPIVVVSGRRLRGGREV